MREYSLEQYKQMSINFNKMSFEDKISTIQKNSDILTLASDYNWWGVKLKDKEKNDLLEESGFEFEIEREWDSKEMDTLVSLLGIDNIGL